MKNRLTPPPAQRLSAVAIAAALAAFAGLAGAQTSPGYVTSSSGTPVYSSQGACVRSAQQGNTTAVCPPMRTASASSPAATPARSSEPTRLAQAGPGTGAAAAGATAASPSSTTAPQATRGYVRSTDGRVVTNAFGNCVRTGQFTPADAAEPCERVARAEMAPPPVVAAAPAPTPAPAPEPKVEAPPAPAPIAVAPVEPPRPVIQKLTLSTDVLFDFGKAELKDSGKQRLDQLLTEVKDADVDEIIAIGHADRIASEDFNQKLSEARAEAVKNYLQQEKGARAQRVTAEGKGESQPVTGEDCKKLGAERAANKKLVACLQPDRRVEIEVLGSRTIAGGAPAAGTGASAPAGSGQTR
jgi:OmpA-OmpF porin, OOP family